MFCCCKCIIEVNPVNECRRWNEKTHWKWIFITNAVKLLRYVILLIKTPLLAKFCPERRKTYLVVFFMEKLGAWRFFLNLILNLLYDDRKAEIAIQQYTIRQVGCSAVLKALSKWNLDPKSLLSRKPPINIKQSKDRGIITVMI